MTTQSIFEISRKFSLGAFITLYEMDLRHKGGSLFRFTNHVFEERVPIKFGGHEYIQMPISMEGIDVDGQGPPAQPRLSIATSGGPVAALIAQYRDLRGAFVRKFSTYDEFLDLMPDPDNEGEVINNPDADAAAIILEDLYVVDRKIGANEVFAEMQLVAPTDVEGVQLPLRIVRKRWCDAHYRVPDANEPDGFFYFEPVDGGCPYAGDQYFDVFDQPTTKEKDRCSKRATGCLARFGNAAGLPMGACPGIRATQET